MKRFSVVFAVAVASFVSMGDVVLPNTSTIAQIQAAIDGAAAGSVITLADGTYVLDQALTVSKGVTLTGSSRDKCILEGGATSLETALIIDNVGACVKNITITNVTTGTSYNFTGVGVRVKSGLFTQSRVTDCKAPAANYVANRTAGVTLEGSDASMTHCLIDHNVGTHTGCIGGVRIMGNGGTMANCIVWANTGVNAGGISMVPNAWKPVKVVNCTVVGNSATTHGGGLEFKVDYYSETDPASTGPWVVNTIISGNTAPDGADIFFNKEESRNYTGYNCLCSSAAYGEYHQTGDPRFRSAETGDFRLLSDSPACHHGDKAKADAVLGYDISGTVDFYGQPRVKHISSGGAADLDIGAAELKYGAKGFAVLQY